jgi:small subunit ribosomal protein S9
MKSIIKTGKRKSAIARAMIKKGTGKISINKMDISSFEPTSARLRLQEPTILAGSLMSKYDIALSITGGGIVGQTSAGRLAIARALIEVEPKLKESFLDYDRQLLVADIRRKEPSKPNCHGQARSKRQTSYR